MGYIGYILVMVYAKFREVKFVSYQIRRIIVDSTKIGRLPIVNDSISEINLLGNTNVIYPETLRK